MKSIALVREALAYARQKTVLHQKQLRVPSLVYGLTLFASDICSYIIDEKSEAYLVFAYLTAIFSVVFSLGYIRIVFLLEEDRPASPWILFAYGNCILPFVGINFALGLPIIALGLFLFKWIPFSLPFTAFAIAYLFLRISFFGYFLAAANSEIRIWKSLHDSYRATRGFVAVALILTMLEFVFLFLGAIPLGIGLIWAVPFVTFANTYVFRRVLRKSAAQRSG